MTSSNIFYPAIFTEEDGGYNVQFIDVPEAITFGDSLEEAFMYAQDALGLALYDKEVIPNPTLNYPMALDGKGKIVLVNLNLQEYRSKMNHKTVKKNTTIPEYLAVLAEKKGLNFSETLREALEAKLLA